MPVDSLICTFSCVPEYLLIWLPRSTYQFRAAYPSASGYVLENGASNPLELGQFATA